MQLRPPLTRLLLDDFGSWLARAVPRPHLDARQQRVALRRVGRAWRRRGEGDERALAAIAWHCGRASACCMPCALPEPMPRRRPTCQHVLQRGGELVGVQRHHAVVVVAGGDHEGLRAHPGAGPGGWRCPCCTAASHVRVWAGQQPRWRALWRAPLHATGAALIRSSSGAQRRRLRTHGVLAPIFRRHHVVDGAAVGGEGWERAASGSRLHSWAGQLGHGPRHGCAPACRRVPRCCAHPPTGPVGLPWQRLAGQLRLPPRLACTAGCTGSPPPAPGLRSR